MSSHFKSFHCQAENTGGVYNNLTIRAQNNTYFTVTFLWWSIAFVRPVLVYIFDMKTNIKMHDTAEVTCT